MCSCQKHRLSCVAACKNCNGEACLNATSQTNCLSDTDHDDNSGDELKSEGVPEDFRNFDIPWFDEGVVETVLT